MEIFNSKEAGRIAGVSLRQIQYWDERGFIRPSIKVRRYSAEHGRALETLRYLTDGEKVFVITSDREKIFDAIDRQFVFSVGIGNLLRELHISLRRAAAATRRDSPRTMRRYVEKQSGCA